MDLKQLENYLISLSDSLTGERSQLLNIRLKSLISVFPFNKFEYILMFLLDSKIINFEDYEQLRNDYISSNKYLELYNLSPRIFGETWAQNHIKDLDMNNSFIKPEKDSDKNYVGQYDLLYKSGNDSIKVEVKSSRAVNRNKKGELSSKALYYKSTDPFWMNFQQIKLNICDIFIFLGVWIDQICYWVLSNEDVKNNKYLSPQHRGGIEYQIGITNKNIGEFEQYIVEPSSIGQAIIKKYRSLSEIT
ncbi:MAG: hypothetical protein ACP5G8_08345 [Athalassotoga sp.]